MLNDPGLESDEEKMPVALNFSDETVNLHNGFASKYRTG